MIVSAPPGTQYSSGLNPTDGAISDWAPQYALSPNAGALLHDPRNVFTTSGESEMSNSSPATDQTCWDRLLLERTVGLPNLHSDQQDAGHREWFGRVDAIP